MMLLLLIGAASGGAVFYRVRGGWDPVPIAGTQTARAIWCLPTGLLVWWLERGGIDVSLVTIGVATAATTFLGLMIPHGFGQSWPVADDRRALRAAFMAGVGVARLALIAAPAALQGHPLLWWVAAFGPLHAAVYWVGWQLPVPDRWRGNDRAPVDFETAWAELLWGAVQWAALVSFSLILAKGTW